MLCRSPFARDGPRVRRPPCCAHPPWLPPSGEFLDLCLANLWNTPMDQLEMAANNFAEFSQMAINRTQVDM